eukprot:CAMPEP_0201590968 /NCGR_PEP_ID=MMETSP0190_2-20130828/183891_1 /ASSEMBLY_ACC=CAM_ASM_000263 /TAXON_ID=37353 /ORGANISM="Rosalina sp." /LENGTH=381 /DNA_ID=CAMNT_0048048229 /DNA_START=148 /DNA_END=1290 /DNA_ORIENTATION=-
MEPDSLDTPANEKKKQMNIQIVSPSNVSPPEKRNSLKNNRPKRPLNNTSNDDHTHGRNNSGNKHSNANREQRPQRPKYIRSKRKLHTKRHHNPTSDRDSLPALNTQIDHNPISVEDNINTSTPLPHWSGISNHIHIQDPSASPSLFSFPSDQSELNDIPFDNALRPLKLQPLELKQNQSSLLVEDPQAREIWEEAGGNEKAAMSLEDMIADLYNYFNEKTMNNTMNFDKRSLGPIYSKFQINDQGHINATKFNEVWKWFDTVCDIVNEMKSFWNSDIATGHGFITREAAEHLLKQEAVGTFIVRFSAPYPDISVTYVDKTKRFNEKTNLSHIKFSRINNRDLYEYSKSGHQQIKRHSLKHWIKTCPEFQYLYTTSAEIVPK